MVYTGAAYYATYMFTNIQVKGVTIEATKAVTTAPPGALVGTATISGTAQEGGTLTASLISGNNTGTLHYQWKSNGANVGTDTNIYTVVAGDIGHTITVEIISSVESGTVTSSATTSVSAAENLVSITVEMLS